MAYGIEAILMTSSHIQGNSLVPTASLSNVTLRTALQQLTRFQLTLRVARPLCSSEASC